MYSYNLTSELHAAGSSVRVQLPMTILMDNQGAKFIAENTVNNRRTRHIDVRYHAIRDWVKQKLFRLLYVPTDKNWADILTKALGRVKFE